MGSDELWVSSAWLGWGGVTHPAMVSRGSAILFPPPFVDQDKRVSKWFTTWKRSWSSGWCWYLPCLLQNMSWARGTACSFGCGEVVCGFVGVCSADEHHPPVSMQHCWALHSMWPRLLPLGHTGSKISPRTSCNIKFLLGSVLISSALIFLNEGDQMKHFWLSVVYEFVSSNTTCGLRLLHLKKCEFIQALWSHMYILVGEILQNVKHTCVWGEMGVLAVVVPLSPASGSSALAVCACGMSPC